MMENQDVNTFESGNSLPIIADRLVEAIDEGNSDLLDYLLNLPVCKEILENEK